MLTLMFACITIFLQHKINYVENIWAWLENSHLTFCFRVIFFEMLQGRVSDSHKYGNDATEKLRKATQARDFLVSGWSQAQQVLQRLQLSFPFTE